MTMMRLCFLVMVLMASISFASTKLDIYVVHMDKAKMEALDVSSKKRWYEAVMDSISITGISERSASIPKLLYIYETAISGFSAKLNEIQLQKLKQVDGFLSAIKDEMLNLHTTHSPQFLGFSCGRGLWNARSLASDVIIGIVDTGIWPEHISFHDYPGISHVPSQWKGKCEAGTKFSAANCNKKLIGARAFFKGYETIVGSINETVDYKSPRDSEGHGTHTASTAAGNLVKGADFLSLAKGSASGIRFTSRIAVYKACYSLGCANSDVLAAMDQAVSDGVDILSLSLGGVSRPYYTDNIAIASFGAIANGVFVSSSAGNSGPRDSSVGNTAPWLMTVAASYTDRSFPTKLKLGDGRVFRGTSLHSGKLITKQIPLVYGAAGGQGAEFCIDGTLSSKLVKGKIVVCDKGINSGVEKGEQVKLAGGAGMVLVNSDTEGEELIADAHVLPAILLGSRAANSIKMYINSARNNATASLEFEGTVYNDPAPVIAAFSSRGPNSAGPDIIKPDVTAPGVNILAAWPPNISPTGLKTDKRSVKFNIVSGTSMSCPHVSGIAALLKSIHKDWSPAAIKSAIMTTAYVLDNTNNPIQDAASSGNSNSASASATPFAFGSGHVDPESAADPGLVYDISDNDYLNYLCSLNYTSSQLAIFSSNKGFSCPDDEVLQPGDLNYPSFAVMFNSNFLENATVTYKRTLTNVGTPNSTYVVTVTEPSGVSVTVDPKVLDFITIGEKLSYEVNFSAALMKERNKSDDHFSFGSITWKSRKYCVRSPIAVTWQ